MRSRCFQGVRAGDALTLPVRQSGAASRAVVSLAEVGRRRHPIHPLTRLAVPSPATARRTGARRPALPSAVLGTMRRQRSDRGMTSAPNSELLTVVRDLSGARDLRRVTEVVRHAARRLTHADGVTFVLRDGDQCYYADEDAIAPLWKGRRFPAAACISGWVMQHRRSAAVRDIYQDERILQDAYRPTFVKSLVMVPVRADEPIAAIGAYWAREHLATAGEVLILEALAEAAAGARQRPALGRARAFTRAGAGCTARGRGGQTGSRGGERSPATRQRPAGMASRAERDGGTAATTPASLLTPQPLMDGLGFLECLSGGAFRVQALRIAHVCPILSRFAPWHAGAALRHPLKT